MKTIKEGDFFFLFLISLKWTDVGVGQPVG